MVITSMVGKALFERLKEAIEDDGRSHRTISLAAGLGPNYVQQLLKKEAPPKMETLVRLLRVLGPAAQGRVMMGPGMPPYNAEQSQAEMLRLSEIMPPRNMQRDVPVLGTVAGSQIERGAFQLTTDVVDYVRRPPGATAQGVYALYVEGSSMEPRYEAGELIYVNPSRPVRNGDYVVIQMPDPDNADEHAIRGYVKQLVRRTGDWVICRQFNPPEEIRFKASDALRIHRVLTTTDMMGV